MIISLQNILSLENVVTCSGCFGLFTKIKQGLAHFFGESFNKEDCNVKFDQLLKRDLNYFLTLIWVGFLGVGFEVGGGRG